MADGSGSPHLTDAELGALIYAVGQNRDHERRAYSHIATCAECTQRLGAMRGSDRDIGRLLSTLDVAVPAKSVESVIQAARTQRVGSAGSWRRAAAIIALLIVAGGAAAAAIPSPLQRFLVTLVKPGGGMSGRFKTGRVATAPESASPAVSFLVSPNTSLEVAFDGAGVGGSVDVKVVDGDQVSLSSPTTAATYRVSTNRIAVDQQSPAHFQLEIPPSLRHLRVRVGRSLVYERGDNAIPRTFTIPLTRPNATR